MHALTTWLNIIITFSTCLVSSFCKQLTVIRYDTHERYLAWDVSRAHEVQLKILNNINTLHRFTDHINNNTYTIDQSVQTFTTFIRDHAFDVFGKTRGRATGFEKAKTKKKQQMVQLRLLRSKKRIQ